MYRFALLFVILSVVFLPSKIYAASSIKGVSLGEFSSGCDYYAIEDSSGDYTIAEWYGGTTTYSGDVIYGELHSYGFKDLYDITIDRSTHVWIDDWLVSEDSAMEKLVDKCGWHRSALTYFGGSYSSPTYTTPPTYEQMCVAQYGVNSTSPTAGKCGCKTGYQWNIGKTQCILSVVEILTSQLPQAYVGQAYSAYINYSYAGTSSLVFAFYDVPDGLDLSYINSSGNNGTFYLKLTPRKSGNYTLKFKVMDGDIVLDYKTITLNVISSQKETAISVPTVIQPVPVVEKTKPISNTQTVKISNPTDKTKVIKPSTENQLTTQSVINNEIPIQQEPAQQEVAVVKPEKKLGLVKRIIGWFKKK
jgi:hypothetical protein